MRPLEVCPSINTLYMMSPIYVPLLLRLSNRFYMLVNIHLLATALRLFIYQMSFLILPSP